MDEYTKWENKAKEAIQRYNNPELTNQQAQQTLQQGQKALDKLREILDIPTGKTEEITNPDGRVIRKPFKID